MAQEDLIPLNERTKEEQKEIVTKGGIASGAARRRKRDMREWAKIIGAMEVTMQTPNHEKIDGDLNGAVIMQMYRKALKGDTKASKFLADLRGEMIQQMEVKDTTPQVVVNNEETRKLLNRLMNKEEE